MEAVFARISDPPSGEAAASFALLDDAIEWAEDQIIYRYGGFTSTIEGNQSSGRAGVAGGFDGRGADGSGIARRGHDLQTGERIVAAGKPANSLFFLRSGVVHIKLPDGVRLATLTAGMAFGEMAMMETHRTADVWRMQLQQPSKYRCGISNASANSIRKPANASCAIWRSCWPTD